VRVLQNFLYWIQFVLITFVLTFPLTVYEGFFREWKYGLATQTFGAWMGDQVKGLLIAIILGGIVAVVLLQIGRWLPNTWHIWGAIVTTLFMIAAIMIAPVYLLPLFNKVTKLDDPRVTQPILSMARANGIPAHDVFEVDASRQTTRMSANVSGFGKTMRITLNDNLLRRGSPGEIQSVMGHEMGHYVLHHIYKDVLFLFVVTVAFFALLRWGLQYSLVRWGAKWGGSGSYRPWRHSPGLFDCHHFLFYSYSHLKYANADGRGRSRYVWIECQPPARRICTSRDSSWGIPENESWAG
jgi:STE24 endopeptidase